VFPRVESQRYPKNKSPMVLHYDGRSHSHGKSQAAPAAGATGGVAG
jgi:hypothetical protein